MVENRKKAMVFDMDGVLIDSEWLVLDCWRQLAEKYRFEGVTEVCHRCLGTNQQVSRQIFLDHYGADFPYEQYKTEGSALFHERAKTELRRKEGVIPLLEYLEEQGILVGLATSTRKEIAMSQLERLGILHFFDQAVCGDMVKNSKPKPDIYLLACEKLGVEPKEAWAVEDSCNGIRSAYRAGLLPVMVPDLAGPTPEMEALSVCILPSLTAVRTWLESDCMGQGLGAAMDKKDGEKK